MRKKELETQSRRSPSQSKTKTATIFDNVGFSKNRAQIVSEETPTYSPKANTYSPKYRSFYYFICYLINFYHIYKKEIRIILRP